MFVAIDIGGTKTVVKGFSTVEISSTLFTVELPTGRSYKTLLEKVFDVILANSRGARVEGIGIAHCGIIDRELGMCTLSVNLPEFQNKPIVVDFANRFNTRVEIANDLICGCLAESRFGFGQTYNKLLFFTASTGIGGAFYYRLSGQEYIVQAELGQMLVKTPATFSSADGTTGLVSLESLAGGKSMEERLVMQSASSDDLLLRESQSLYLSTALVNGIVMFNPEIVVLAGGIIEHSDYLTRKLQQETAKQLAVRGLPPVKTTQMGRDVVVNGALALLAI